ncbi:hypothetical protein LCGC14_1867750, partial [marine sediment metagenome]
MQTRIWYKNSDPTVVISTGKSSGGTDESFFLSDIKPDDDEFYTIGQGPPQVLVRKSQGDIDSIIAARQQVATDYQQKQADADNEIKNSAFKDLTFSQVENWIDNNIQDNNGTDLSGVRAALKIVGKGLLALFKKRDESD